MPMREGSRLALIVAPIASLVGLNLYFDNAGMRKQLLVNDQRMQASETKNTVLHNASTVQRDINTASIKGNAAIIAALQSEVAVLENEVAALKVKIAELRAAPPKPGQP